MGLKNGNTFGAVAFTSYGAFWWWYAFLVWTVGAGWISRPILAVSVLCCRNGDGAGTGTVVTLRNPAALSQARYRTR